MQSIKPQIKTLLVVAIISVIITVTGIWFFKTEKGVDSNGLPLGKVTSDFLSSRPESSLYYPGAEVLSVLSGSEERNYIEGGKNSAYLGAKLVSSDSPEEIYQWYKDWLLSNGWQPRDVARATSQVSAQGYSRGNRELFGVAIYDPEFLNTSFKEEVLQNGGTVFDIRYLIIPASEL